MFALDQGYKCVCSGPNFAMFALVQPQNVDLITGIREEDLREVLNAKKSDESENESDEELNRKNPESKRTDEAASQVSIQNSGFKSQINFSRVCHMYSSGPDPRSAPSILILTSLTSLTLTQH